MFDHFPKKYRIRHSLGATSMLVSGRTRVRNHRQNPQCFFFSVGLEMGLHEDMKHPQVMNAYDIWGCPPAKHSRTIIFLVGDPYIQTFICPPEATQLPKSLRQLPSAIKACFTITTCFFSKACAGFKNCYISLWPQHALAIFFPVNILGLRA